MKIKLALLAFAITISAMASCSTFAQGRDSPIGMKNQKPRISATEWRHMYFAGVSKQPVNQIDLSEGQISGLLSLINTTAAISSGTAIEPQYLINSKGTTPWLAMYALVHIQDPEALSLVASGKSRIYVPSKFIRSAFGDHINWPRAMLKKYDLSLGQYHVFAIPFLVHRDSPPIGTLSRSMKAPDGSLEIFGVHELLDGNPERLLKEFAELASFIKTNRADALR